VVLSGDDRLVARLGPLERKRLLRLIAATTDDDAATYVASPVRANEFSADEEPLAWDAEGWDKLP
jgi:hypothetical protein